MIRLERPPTASTMLLTKGKILTNRDRAALDANPAEILSGEWPFPPADGKDYGAVGVKRALAKMHNCKSCYCERKLPLKQLAVEERGLPDPIVANEENDFLIRLRDR